MFLTMNICAKYTNPDKIRKFGLSQVRGFSPTARGGRAADGCAPGPRQSGGRGQAATVPEQVRPAGGGALAPRLSRGGAHSRLQPPFLAASATVGGARGRHPPAKQLRLRGSGGWMWPVCARERTGPREGCIRRRSVGRGCRGQHLSGGMGQRLACGAEQRRCARPPKSPPIPPVADAEEWGQPLWKGGASLIDLRY